VSFFIGFPLLTGCGSGRDQPNHFFALFVGEQCVNNEENRAWAKFANGAIPFLILIVKNVSNRHSVRVIEDQCGGWEINAVSREVVFVLLLVVFESRPVIQKKVPRCTYICQYIVPKHKGDGMEWLTETTPAFSK
jgi:hypothetical protein